MVPLRISTAERPHSPVRFGLFKRKKCGHRLSGSTAPGLMLLGCVVALFSCSNPHKTHTSSGSQVISETVTVFESGAQGYKSFRIPAIIKAPDGSLLAFAEGRVDGGADFGHVKIVVRSSKDQGDSWSTIRVAASNGKLQAGNPAPIVDYTDPAYPKGRIFLFYNTGNVDEGEMRKKLGVREVWYVTSTDNGNSWSAPVNITDQTSKIDQPRLKTSWNHPEDWRSYANTPGHGLQIQTGPHKGRLYVAANHSEGDPKADFTDYVAHGFYSDDHGKSFHISDNNAFRGSNESTAAEISNGRLMMNSRDQSGRQPYRIVAISSDAGQSWDTTYYDKQLPDPVCEGAIVTLQYQKKQKGHNILAFSNAASKTSRDSLTLRISYDDGLSWKDHYLIDPKNTAYSDLVALDKNQVGILYEAEGYHKINFKKVNWKHGQ
ncbi:sialidase-1 [Arachidicoccus rhizosphaerae]|uniref:exo-alpha-sialidase n=1 Tax=Arachidicoccus rhizosphaerae TaxID=551991 RepID=A0A1H3ZLB8_9BACT|nr:sialidase family protein [Arachidicoccus rhizosphaerae]SEA24543.1 sialidase-1 [Arachidicoccus rhizosphaerae]